MTVGIGAVTGAGAAKDHQMRQCRIRRRAETTSVVPTGVTAAVEVVVEVTDTVGATVGDVSRLGTDRAVTGA
jgi:hypothetical protein